MLFQSGFILNHLNVFTIGLMLHWHNCSFSTSSCIHCYMCYWLCVLCLWLCLWSLCSVTCCWLNVLLCCVFVSVMEIWLNVIYCAWPVWPLKLLCYSDMFTSKTESAEDFNENILAHRKAFPKIPQVYSGNNSQNTFVFGCLLILYMDILCTVRATYITRPVFFDYSICNRTKKSS